MIKGIKLQPREKFILTVALLCLVGYAFYSLWFSRYESKINAANQKTQELQNEVKKNQALLARTADLNAHKGEIETKAANLQRQLPSVEALPSAMADMGMVFTSNGLEVKRMELIKGAQKKGLDPGLDYRAVKVTFSGGYPAVLAAVKSLETSSQRTFTVTDFSLSRKIPPLLDGIMTVEIYFAKTPLPGSGYQPVLETQGKADPFAG